LIFRILTILNTANAYRELQVIYRDISIQGFQFTGIWYCMLTGVAGSFTGYFFSMHICSCGVKRKFY